MNVSVLFISPLNFSGLPSLRRVGDGFAIAGSVCGDGGGGVGGCDGGGIGNNSCGTGGCGGGGCNGGDGGFEDSSFTAGNCGRVLGPGSAKDSNFPRIEGVEGVEGCGVSIVGVKRVVVSTFGMNGWKYRDSTGCLVSLQYQTLLRVDQAISRSAI